MARTYEISFSMAAQLAGNFARTMSSAQGALDAMTGKLGELEQQAKQAGRLADLRVEVERSQMAYAAASQRAEELAQQIKASAAPTKRLKEEFKQAENAVLLLGAQMAASEQPTEQLRAEYENAKLRLGQLSQEMRTNQRENNKLAAEFNKSKKAVDSAEKSLERERLELDQLTSNMKAAGTSTAELVRRQEQLAKAADRAKKAQEGLQNVQAAQQANQNRRGELRAQMLDAVGLAVAMGAPIKMAAEWEQNLAELNKVANATPEELAAISAQAQELAVATGVARDGIIGAYTAAAQGGLARDEWAKFAEASAKMGVAFDSTGDDAGKMLMAWQAGMGLTLDQSIALASAVNHLGNSVKNATSVDIGGVLQRQGGTFAMAGLNEAQGAALAAGLLSGGATEEIAATAGKNLVLSLTKGMAATKNQRAALEALGFDDPVRLARAMQKAPEEAIIMVMERLKGVDEAALPAIAGQLFGTEGVGEAAKLVAGLDNLKHAFKLVGDSADYATSLEDEFNAMGNTTQQQAAKAREGLKSMGTAVGAVLLPALNSMLATMAPIALSLAKFAQENQGLTTVIVGTVAAFMAAKIAAITIGYAYTFVKGAVLGVKAALLIGRTAWLLYTGALTAATAASKTAIIVSKAMAAGVWLFNGAIKAAIIVSKAMTVATWLFNGAMLANPITWVVLGIVALIAAGIALYKNWDKVTAFFSLAWEKIKALFFNFSPLGIIINNWEPIKAWVLDFGAKIWGYINQAWEGLKAIFFNFHPLGLIINNFQPMLDWLNGLSFAEMGANLLNTLADGIKSAVMVPVEAMKGALDTIREYLPFSDAKVGPLSELTASGAAVMTTLAEGMESANTAQVTAPLGVIGDALPSQTLEGAATSLGGGAAGGRSGGGGIVLNFSPTINVSGASGADAYNQAKAGAEAGAGGLMEQLRKAVEQERRLSYA